MTTPTTTYEIVPLAQLKLSPLNARFGRTVDTADLEVSIPAAGRLAQPLDCYRDGDAVMVWDGGRRLATLEKLAKAKSLPASLKPGIPCLVSATAEDAAKLSLVTFVREGMTAEDEFLAYERLAGQGLSPTEIAAACNKSTPRVAQLLRLVALAPDCLTAFKAGKIPLDVAEALTLTDDHARQVEVLKAFNPKKDNAHGVRQNLRKGAMDANDRWAVFVGEEAYAAAGGRFLRNLFTNAGDAWEDRELVERLAKEKLDALVKKVEAEGWEWVEVSTASWRYYQWDKGFDRLAGKKDTFTLEQKASAGVSIVINSKGGPDIERGLVKKAKGKKTAAGGNVAPAIDQALYGYGHGGHEHLTAIATGAVQVALAADPAAAYDALLTSLAWLVFRESGRGQSGANIYETYESNASSLSPGQGRYGLQSDEIAGMTELKARKVSWHEQLPHARVEFCDAVAILPADQKAQLLALCFAWTVNAVEHRFDSRSKVRWAHLGWMAGRAGVDMVKAWKPDAEFLKKGSREALTTAIGEMDAAYGGMSGSKKGELVNYVAAHAGKIGWVPKLLATFVPVPAAKAEKSAKAPSKRMFKDEFAAQIAETSAVTDSSPPEGADIDRVSQSMGLDV